MDKLTIFFRVLELVPRFLPKKPPPKLDFGPLYEALPPVPQYLPPGEATVAPAHTSPELSRYRPAEEEKEEIVATSSAAREMEKMAEADRQQTGCIACSRSHLSTVSGALGESLRFAREDGISHPEVQRRLMLAEDEINIMERIDLAPDALAASPPEERQLAEEYLPRIRALRQDMGVVSSVENLEKVAADASVLGQEFRLRHLQLKGVDLNPVMELAKKVQAGEMPIEEAKERLRELLPEEE